MADDHELHSPAVQRTLDTAVEDLSDLVRHHEVTDHGGAPCMTERMNMVAWVAHRIGWAPASESDSALLALTIAAYKKHHDEEHRHG